ncbi:MAG: hypothetical protein PHT38_00330 [Halothiobacillus sp.]|nr:hypothetical protein [Halothiobacillus sp.]
MQQGLRYSIDSATNGIIKNSAKGFLEDNNSDAEAAIASAKANPECSGIINQLLDEIIRQQSLLIDRMQVQLAAVRAANNRPN